MWTVEEFTAAGELIPSGRIDYAGANDAEEALERQGWTLAWQMEARDVPAEKPVSANVYVEAETGHILIDLMTLGVRNWILCNSTLAYLSFVRDWLSRLADPKRDNEFREAVTSFAGDVLDEVSGWFDARPPQPATAGARAR
jgi:hypothetical protein